MRIVQVCPYAWNARGGVQSHVASLARQLRSRGHDVLVIAPEDPAVAPAARAKGLELVGSCIRVPYNGSVAPVCIQPGAWRQVMRVVDRFAPDLIHVHEPLSPSLSMPASWSSRAPVVATFHAYCPRRLEAGMYSVVAACLRPWSRRFALKLAVSEAAASSIARRVAPPVHVVPNGVDVERFAHATPKVLATGPKVLFVCRLDQRKGFDTLLRAFGLLIDRIPGVQCIVAGDGPHRAALAGVPPQVRARVTMLGDVPAEELPSVYAAADVFVACARGHESFGIVLLEAMAAGLPIVASNIAGYREVVRHDREAWLIEPDDAEGVARAVARILTCPELARRLAEGGRVRVADFQWDFIADQIERLYVSVTERANASVLAASLDRRRRTVRSDD
jgi:phosphatidylinositol alpha-mannosyltransferase